MKNIFILLSCLGYFLTAVPTAWAQSDSTSQQALTLFQPNKKAQVAFRTESVGNLTGAVTTLDPKSINEYDYNVWASSAIAGRTLGMLGGSSIRGVGIGIDVGDLTGSGLFSGNALFVVDGLPRDIEGLRFSEIESISILKDINASILYGSAAVNGVVLITTKRGKVNKPTSEITINYGLSTPRELPRYMNSADYMTTFNQARENDGLAPQYTDATIENYRSGNPYRFPSTDYYADEFLKPFKTYHDVSAAFSGGDENARFYSNIGWNSSGGIMDFGEGKNERNDVINIRGNVDLKVTNRIKTAIDAVALFGSDQGPRGNYWWQASTIRPHEYTPLLPFDLIDSENSLLQGRKNDVNGQYLLGGNNSYLTNPFGDGYAAGSVQDIYRKFTFNNRIDFDLSDVTPGLSAHSNISFDFFTAYNQTIANEYSVYEPVWSDTDDKIVELKQHGRDTRPGTQVVGNSRFRRRVGFYGQLKYDRTFRDDHRFTANLLAFGSSYKENGDFQGVKNAHIGLQMAYLFRNKYSLDFSSNLANSVKLPENNRTGFSPSIGLSWALHEESFLSSVKAIDYLKLRVSAGILKTDLPIGGFFYYDNRYGGSGSYNWYEGTRNRSGVASSWSANSSLGFARRNELNLGLDGLFFNKTIGIQGNVFYNLYDRLVTRPGSQYPGYYSDFIAYQNFESDRYVGAELGLNFNKQWGDWNVFLGTNLLYITSKRVQVDEIYDNEYQNRSGQPRDATFGLEALGLFKDQADIDNSPIQSFGTVQPGDIKYKDQNNDGIINTNDEVYLRRWQAPFSAGLQVRVSYKNWSLYLLGEGQNGAKNFRESSYFWIDGNDKYSESVSNSWTPATHETATYPRLSTQTSSNNLRRSSYWLYKNDYFQLRKAQINYSLPSAVCQTLRMRQLNLFANTSDLFQISKNRKIRDLRVGSEPSYRSFSLGVRANF
ncbi:TonB-linked SusC/RagA family outer membrane protein [Dyadobacter jejuensis]|uniref:TonB-linked SusC/RagA family outer membrane protein n=1 Tax=Dyadobacter jejuensis TaxID=1082580 RepID=A0A316AGL3_9BACT|nr:SusC/RagA family TonB-linked outer membrane protein [Dyadobacter jejuensis]PWJ56926.1 TonB-linked SusC/RagA family outer membrane protein [Dyadobacter jejuensis]